MFTMEVYRSKPRDEYESEVTSVFVQNAQDRGDVPLNGEMFVGKCLVVPAPLTDSLLRFLMAPAS